MLNIGTSLRKNLIACLCLSAFSLSAMENGQQINTLASERTKDSQETTIVVVGRVQEDNEVYYFEIPKFANGYSCATAELISSQLTHFLSKETIKASPSHLSAILTLETSFRLASSVVIINQLDSTRSLLIRQNGILAPSQNPTKIQAILRQSQHQKSSK